MKSMSFDHHYDNSDGTFSSFIIALSSYIALGVIHLTKAFVITTDGLSHIPPIVIESAQLISYIIGATASSVVVYKFFKYRKNKNQDGE